MILQASAASHANESQPACPAYHNVRHAPRGNRSSMNSAYDIESVNSCLRLVNGYFARRWHQRHCETLSHNQGKPHTSLNLPLISPTPGFSRRTVLVEYL